MSYNTLKKYEEIAYIINFSPRSSSKLIPGRDGPIIEAIGEDTSREGLIKTPQRVASMYSELFSGMHTNPDQVLTTDFAENHNEMVVAKDVNFFSICEHHFLPFQGKADIAYVPTGRVVGASKLVRLLEIFAKRPQIQERLTNQIADTLNRVLQPSGVGVVLQAEHMCMTMRGINKPGSQIVTSAMRGNLKTDQFIRNEFELLRGK